ncbi:DNA polymerase Y family protein [Rheinheimera pacifica]|uniref:Y-family DNA polymerase n=1 Tax=Rheinheimera pacifica TaxID=173990 RepID=UPI002ED9994C
MALYLYLQFPALQPDSLDCAAVQQLPVAVVNEQHCIVQLNAEAGQRGIALNMALGTAAALCPNLQLLPYQPQLQLNILQSVAQQLYQITADIALDPPDGLYIRLCNMLQLYQGLTGYWQALNQELKLLPYRYYYASGATPFAAKCLARQQLNLLTGEPEALATALNHSPLRFTELDTDSQQQLQRLGINTLGQLLALSQAELARRFDSSLLSYLGRLRGSFYHALHYIKPEHSFSRYVELLYDIIDTAVLSKPLQALLQQLEQQLQRINAACHQLQLSLLFRGMPAHRLSIGSAQGEYRAANWLKLCQLQLDKLKLTEPVSGLQLEVTAFVAQQSQSDDLFQPVPGAVSPLQLVSLLQARLGYHSVSGLTLQNQHLPEQASQRPLPLLTGKSAVTALALRPAFLLAKPQRLTETVEISQGPERLCPDGWALDAQRDYFIGRNSKGQWLWLYRTAQQQWFVQGIFS